ncbi:glycoside hydrolase family 95 protein ['Paenibacillus yunnanensis' Narsing Rao et al. 2020]|uniref:glycoside hydrolase family 95 protein n=1 Tax=Paenibacillus tengchongensis TaxID=2608684 RepID=UPI00124E24CB|nr:glycoside hydrolase family 95 protein [Paenibacillus tengchongensis]
MNELKLWYDKPAERWEEALPLGNGTLGGMVFGTTGLDRIQLNEDSLWYGGPMERNNPQALDHLDEIRSLLFGGEIAKAEALAVRVLSGVPDGQRHYEPLGDLYVDSGSTDMEVSEYRRELDLRDGIARTEYCSGRTEYSREYFTSFPDQVMAVRLAASRKGALSFSVLFGRGTVLEPTPWSDILKRPVGFQAFVDSVVSTEQGDLMIRGRSGGEEGVRFCCGIRVVTEGGRLSPAAPGQITVEQANAATILVAACTDFRIAKDELESECIRRLEQAAAKPYEQLRAGHVCDYRSLAGRMELSLRGVEEKPERAELSTDRRLEAVRNRESDPGLAALYFQFGRYLLIASSRPGSLPANLQGIWNRDMLPIWDSKYTININTQMNYWAAESSNLPECHEPLFQWMERLRVRGRETARTMYGCGGFVAHHNSDIWGDTAPQDICITSTFWTMGAAWLCLHLWDHFEYSGNVQFLRDSYATMKEAAVFLLDFMVEDPSGQLVTCPSSSPENRYILPGGESGALCYGASMDSQITRELFARCIAAAEILDEDFEFRRQLSQALAKIPRPAVGKYGQIQEWSIDYEEVEPGHRHISHLFALHPGTQITLRETPALAVAAKATLERRLCHGGGHTGWSRAWILNMWARLEEPELAHENVTALLASSTLPNLFCDHPPFQIDGNFGGCAGIAEMLLQSHAGELRLLPALPKAWPHGHVRGLRARGGYEVELEWQDGELQRLVVQAAEKGNCKVSWRERSVELTFPEPESRISLTGADFN